MKDLPRSPKVYIALPKKDGPDFEKIVLDMLRTRNKWLPIEEWRLVNKGKKTNQCTLFVSAKLHR